MPQKFVIVYVRQCRTDKVGTIVELERCQLTVVCNLYTKCARLSKTILIAMGGSQKPPPIENDEMDDPLDENLEKEGKFCKQYLDKIVTIELEVLVDFIFKKELEVAVPEKKPSKTELRQKELMLVSYQGFTINANHPKDAEKNVKFVEEDRVKSMSELKKTYYGRQKGHWDKIGSGFNDEDALNIRSCVPILVVGGYLIVMKEHWKKWKQFKIKPIVRDNEKELLK